MNSANVELILTSCHVIKKVDREEFKALMQGIAEVSPPGFTRLMLIGERTPHGGGRDRCSWTVSLGWAGDWAAAPVASGCDRAQVFAVLHALRATFHQWRACYVRLAADRMLGGAQ